MSDQHTDISEHTLSAIEGIGWPAVPGREGASLLAVLFQLEQSQWWPAEKLRVHQLGQIERLCNFARQHIPYLKRRLDAAGITEQETLSDEVWQRLPVLTRDELQKAGTKLQCTEPPKAHSRTNQSTTTGSTGKPVSVRRTELSGFYWTAFTLRDHMWRKRDLTATFATIRYDRSARAAYPDGIQSDNWGSPAALFRTGRAAKLTITTPTADQAEWLARQNAAYLSTNPSNLGELLRHSDESGIRFPTLREVQTLSEVLDPALREECRRLWDVEIADRYSTQETGYIALQCPESENYHIQSECALVEILDADGAPCRPGEIGRVVVTPLHNFATPLLRYDIGDYAEVGNPCPCGRGLPVLKRIMGRARAMLTLPDGGRSWPLMGGSRFAEIAPVRQYQFVQKSPQRIEARLVVARPLSDEEEGKLRERMLSRLGHPFDIEFSYVKKIERRAGEKYEEFKSEI